LRSVGRSVTRREIANIPRRGAAAAAGRSLGRSRAQSSTTTSGKIYLARERERFTPASPPSVRPSATPCLRPALALATVARTIPLCLGRTAQLCLLNQLTFDPVTCMGHDRNSRSTQVHAVACTVQWVSVGGRAGRWVAVVAYVVGCCLARRDVRRGATTGSGQGRIRCERSFTAAEWTSLEVTGNATTQ